MGSSWPGQRMQVQEELELRSCRLKKKKKKAQVLQTLKCMDAAERFNDSGTQHIWLPETAFSCGSNVHLKTRLRLIKARDFQTRLSITSMIPLLSALPHCAKILQKTPLAALDSDSQRE